MRPKQLFLLLAAAITMLLASSCVRRSDRQTIPICCPQTIFKDEASGNEIAVYVIDSCEYIGKIGGYNNDVLTHKGNCKFCAERNKNKK